MTSVTMTLKLYQHSGTVYSAVVTQDGAAGQEVDGSLRFLCRAFILLWRRVYGSQLLPSQMS